MTLEEAYRIYLGREPDAGGLAANKQLYGNELDNKELEQFLYGAAPEIRARDTTGGTFSVEDLYLGGLRRAGDPGGIEFYKEQFGPEISDQELVRFMLGGAGELPNAPMYGASTDVDQGMKTISDVTDREKSTSAVVSETPEQKAERARIDSLMARKGDLTKFITPLLENVPYGQKLGVGTEGASNVGLLNLYKNVLGRRPDEAGYRSNLAAFGPTLSMQEIADFRAGAVPELNRQRIAQEQLVDKIRTGAASNLVAAPTRPTLAPNFQYVPGSLTSIPQNIVDLYQTELGRAPDLAGGMNRAYMYGPSIEPGEVANFRQGAIDSGEVKAYAGGPVTGSPQYFAEGGESKGMTKYSGKDLGSTFDVSEYIDESGKLVGGQLVPVVEEGVTVRYDYKPYEQNVVFGRELREAEKEARAAMAPRGGAITSPELERMFQALMIRRGQTGKEYGLPLIASGFTPSGVRPINQYTYAKGGDVSGIGQLAVHELAREIQKLGRGNDKILAHITPQEAAILESMGGSGEINPNTGLPEFGFSWKKLFKVAGMALPFFGLPPITTALLSGTLAGASTPGKAFDLKKAVISGIGSYASSSIGESLANASGNVVDAATKGATDAGLKAAEQFTNVYDAADPSFFQKVGTTLSDTASKIGSDITNYRPSQTADFLGNVAEGAGKVISGDKAALAAMSGTIPRLTTAVGAYGATEAMDQARLAEAEARRKREEEAKYWADYAGGLFQANPYGYAMGGEVDPVAFEGGGMTAQVNQPRMLSGGGDGMSDSIPATIDGTQPARLADGEFVIPADVVADIGNGSSSAGAKRLYGMMDRVRTARHGTTKQPPEIKMNRLMPA